MASGGHLPTGPLLEGQEDGQGTHCRCGTPCKNADLNVPTLSCALPYWRRVCHRSSEQREIETAVKANTGRLIDHSVIDSQCMDKARIGLLLQCFNGIQIVQLWCNTPERWNICVSRATR